jgi:superfamily II DNA or RNA helicase
MDFQPGERVALPARSQIPGWAVIDFAYQTADGWQLYVKTDTGTFHRVDLSEREADELPRLTEDGHGDAAQVLAGLWTAWMRAASARARSAALASSPLRPYAHQLNAVYGAMLPQPRLRFLLADEPGTGKTIMAGMYLREMQRLGFIQRALVVAPAHLVTKWQADFERFFGGGLWRISAQTVQEHALETDHDLWIVSLDLAAVNPGVQDAIRPDRAGWDAVVFDEAHRLTPTAESYYRVGDLLAKTSPRALLMTATPHRGKEWLFRALLHLVDPDVFPPQTAADEPSFGVRPGRIHFLRRMKEDLVDFDGTTPLFKGRRAQNHPVPLNSVESAYYTEALDMVGRFFQPAAVPLARMVYAKRAASSLHALAETLRRRREGMGSALPTTAAYEADPDGEDPTAADEAKVVVESSKAAKQERKEIDALLARLAPLLGDPAIPVSKWSPLIDASLAANGIAPGNGEQAVVFTEYADTADWLVTRLRAAGFTAERYSGRDAHHVRDKIRARFAGGDFQVLVSTDAGNEGIDLQTAHVLVNWDIPWSLVRLEQRMGRIHRIGQNRDVELYNLVATDTREGEVLHVLLTNFVTAANRLGGRLFDSLSLVAELNGLSDDRLSRLLAAMFGDDSAEQAAAAAAIEAVTAARIEHSARAAERQEDALRSTVDVAAAVAALHDERLERINPAIIEAYLNRLAAAGTVSLAPHAAGDGVFTVSLSDRTPLPPEFAGADGAGRTCTGPNSAVVVTSGAALIEARAAGAGVADAVSLGPSDLAYRALVSVAADRLRPSLWRGAALLDDTSATDYDLLCFEAPLNEAGGRRTSTWSCLIRVDAAGARVARWEALANLRADNRPGRPPHDGRVLQAKEAAGAAAIEERRRRAAALDEWLASAERELRRLPDQLTDNIADRDVRIAERRRLTGTTAQRLRDLRQMSEVAIGDAVQVGWAHVCAAAPPATPAEKDSEAVSMRHVADLLTAQRFAVADVHSEGRGYDLHATRGREQRLIEVKGVWRSASSDGISMTGNEILIATQHGPEYWLYVVDNCADGKGSLYGSYADPTRTFEGLLRDVALVRVPGSALKEARTTEETVPCG